MASNCPILPAFSSVLRDCNTAGQCGQAEVMRSNASGMTEDVVGITRIAMVISDQYIIDIYASMPHADLPQTIGTTVGPHGLKHPRRLMPGIGGHSAT